LPHPGHLGALALSLGALGVVYGDIGTSPLYTMQLVFTLHPLAPTPTHVYGAVSLIFWSLVMVVTLKYVLLILRADNHGEGGIMALVALIERCVQGRRRTALILVGILGASLFYGDGMLTPAISVVSAVSGLQVASPALAAQIVPFSLAILVALFALQRFGTGTIGVLFGPIMLIWFAVLAFIGAKQVLLHPDILKALSPSYGASFLFGEPSAGFLSLASVFLAVTGAESIYADMGHFGRPAITRAWLAVALPALVVNYLGQGALIVDHPGTISNPFFLMVPGGQTAQTAMVILATAATVIASQAVISGAYSVTQQLVQLGFLPRISIRHTSQRIIGQIYIPLVNWFLLAAVVTLVLVFRDPQGLAAAYGVALSAIFATNTLLAFTVFRSLWHKPLWMVVPGAAAFLTVELAFFAANLGKLFSGGWLPLAVGAVFFVILTTWRRGRANLHRQVREGTRRCAGSSTG
jgi:KUP system potassium uptake protein